jgi:hypothetical protein
LVAFFCEIYLDGIIFFTIFASLIVRESTKRNFRNKENLIYRLLLCILGFFIILYFMKIFIINKSYFDEILTDRAKFVHQNLYNEFIKRMSTKEDVRDLFIQIHPKHESEAHFQFSHAVGNVYFFRFLSTVS